MAGDPVVPPQPHCSLEVCQHRGHPEPPAQPNFLRLPAQGRHPPHPCPPEAAHRLPCCYSPQCLPPLSAPRAPAGLCSTALARPKLTGVLMTRLGLRWALLSQVHLPGPRQPVSSAPARGVSRCAQPPCWEIWRACPAYPAHPTHPAHLLLLAQPCVPEQSAEAGGRRPCKVPLAASLGFYRAHQSQGLPLASQILKPPQQSQTTPPVHIRLSTLPAGQKHLGGFGAQPISRHAPGRQIRVQGRQTLVL